MRMNEPLCTPIPRPYLPRPSHEHAQDLRGHKVLRDSVRHVLQAENVPHERLSDALDRHHHAPADLLDQLARTLLRCGIHLLA
jgi:hypothetical protein